MTKKKLFVLFVAMLSLVLVVAGCGGGSDTSSEGETPTEEGATNEEVEKIESSQPFLRISSGPLGSGWYAMTASFSELWMDRFNGLNVSQFEGSGIGNLRVVDEGIDAEMGITYSPEFAAAKEGTGIFEGEQKDNVAAFGSLTPNLNYFAVLANRDDINSVEDLLDKRVFLGPRDSGGVVSLWRVLDLYGITEETFEEHGGSLYYGSWADGASQLGDGIVDAWFGGSPPNEPNPSLAEIDLNNPIKLVGFDAEILEQATGLGIGLGMSDSGIMYGGQESGVGTFTQETVLFVSSSLDEEFVYNLSKILWENVDALGGLSENRKGMISAQTAINNVNPDYFHPGAARYLQEVGVLE